MSRSRQVSHCYVKMTTKTSSKMFWRLKQLSLHLWFKANRLEKMFHQAIIRLTYLDSIRRYSLKPRSYLKYSNSSALFRKTCLTTRAIGLKSKRLRGEDQTNMPKTLSLNKKICHPRCTQCLLMNQLKDSSIRRSWTQTWCSNLLTFR